MIVPNVAHSKSAATMTREEKGVGQAVTLGVTLGLGPKLAPLHRWLQPSLGLEHRINS
jgi:hypothetical protein